MGQANVDRSKANGPTMGLDCVVVGKEKMVPTPPTTRRRLVHKLYGEGDLSGTSSLG